ncbi:MAG: isochorismatase hydrolase [Candidatus Acidoferrum typicum]|nr:isochorismatase hydrolase [Candidatus Acidoferrum typicum]
MVSRSVIFWDVDTQADFMLPGGKLYVPGAEKLIPNLKRLTDAARQGRAFIIGDACTHTPDDPEFARFPPHCVQDTPGAKIIPETRAGNVLFVPNRAGWVMPKDLSEFQQVILEKQTLDVFDNPNTEKVLERVGGFTDADAEIFVFGVVTEYCVRLAAKGLLARGRRVALVHDAIETLNAEDGRKTIEELTSLGARLVTTEQALTSLEQSATRSA